MGRDFFHSLYRMHKDALADGAKLALDQIFGPLPEATDDDGNNEDNGNGSDKNNSSSSWNYWWLLALLFIPGLMIGIYFGMRNRRKKTEQRSSRTTVSSNLLHASDIEIIS